MGVGNFFFFLVIYFRWWRKFFELCFCWVYRFLLYVYGMGVMVKVGWDFYLRLGKYEFEKSINLAMWVLFDHMIDDKFYNKYRLCSNRIISVVRRSSRILKQDPLSNPDDDKVPVDGGRGCDLEFATMTPKNNLPFAAVQGARPIPHSLLGSLPPPLELNKQHQLI